LYKNFQRNTEGRRAARNIMHVYNMQVYIGREEGQNREMNQGQRVVLDLVSELEKSGRNVTCDNFLRASVWLENLLNVK